MKFKPETSQATQTEILKANNAALLDEIPQIKVKILKVADENARDAAITALSHNPKVEYAEEDLLVLPDVIPNDPLYSSAWHLPKIEAPAAWDKAKATGILIGICDTGVDAAQPDLAPVLRGDLGYNTADGSTNWSPVMYHGTAVAGTAAAATNNGVEVSGVAWGAMIIPVRITNRTDGAAYESDASKCIIYAVDKGARAINLSYRMAGSNTIDSAGKYAQGKAAVTTVAAGNDGTDPGWSNYPGFLAVSATDSGDNRASWSNYGAFVDVAAPGVSIITTNVGTSYMSFSGTSASSPVAAGVLALIFGANPSLSASQAQDKLLSSADDLGAAGWDSYYGAGRVNARKAVEAALGASPSPTGSVAGAVTDSATAAAIAGATVTDGTRSATTNASGAYTLASVPAGTYTVTASASGYTSASQSVSVTAGQTATANFALGNTATTGSISGTVTDASTASAIAGATVTNGAKSATSDASGGYTLANVPAGTYTVTASASGYNSASQTVSVAAGQSAATINFGLSPPMSVDSIACKKVGKNLRFDVKVLNQNGNAMANVQVTADLTNPLKNVVTLTGATGPNGIASLTVQKAQKGAYTVKVTKLLAGSVGNTWDGNTKVNSASCTY